MLNTSYTVSSVCKSTRIPIVLVLPKQEPILFPDPPQLWIAQLVDLNIECIQTCQEQKRNALTIKNVCRI